MIYLILTQDNQFCKIGYAVNPVKRLAELQTGMPYTLRLLAMFPGSRTDEAEWHADYAADRVRGEWFRVTPRLMREFIGIMANEVPDIDPKPYAKLTTAVMPLRPSFWPVARLSSRLWDLAMDAASVVDDGERRSFCANRIWYDYYKPRLQHLVGFEASGVTAEARTMQAYRTAYQAVYHCLPDCRGCICVA